MPMTAGDHVRIAMSRLAGLQELEAMTLYAESMRYLYSKHKWLFLMVNGVVNTEASYSTGTITVTNGSPLISIDAGSGGVWDNVNWLNRRINIGAAGASSFYELSFLSATTANLQINGVNVNWPGLTSSANAYVIYRDIYPLPANIDWGRDQFWIDPVNVQDLFIIDPAEMHRLKSNLPFGTPGNPEAVSRGLLIQTATTVAPVAYVEFGPEVPNGAQSYNFYGFIKPVVTTSDLQYPLWPEEFEDLIWRRMEITYAQNPRHRVTLDPLLIDEYRNRLFECIKRNNGGAEILRVKQTYRGQRRRLPFSNSVVFPGVAGGWSS